MGLIIAAVSNHSIYRNFVEDAMNPSSKKDVIEEGAKSIVEKLHQNTLTGDRTRYKFTQDETAREQALKLIFDSAFQANPEEITIAAQWEHPSQTAFYPRWEKICWTQIPTVVSTVVNNPFFKIALSICALYYAHIACYAAYRSCAAITMRSIPFIINNTPIVVFKVTNTILDVKDWVYSPQIAIILLCSWVAQQIILVAPVLGAPEIPYLTPLARWVSIGSILTFLYPEPESLSSFIWNKGIATATFTWRTCNDVSDFIEERVERTQNERLAICKQKSYEVWRTLMIQNAPVA
jgi:hypothetical protein